MSIFQSLQMSCPACGTPADFALVHSVNADRRPDLREEILAGRFQRRTCSHCQTEFRIDPQFVYVDQRRGLWIAANGVGALAEWPAREAAARELFDTSYGKGAPPVVQRQGRHLKPRLVFGWAALREKIVALEAGLDDTAVELTKMVLLRSAADAPFDANVSVRLMAVQLDRLLFGWVRNHDTAIGDLRWIARSAYDGIVVELKLGSDSDWAESAAAFDGACFVDLDRLMVQASSA